MSATYKDLKLNSADGTFNDCLISSLLKRHFSSTQSAKDPFQIQISKNIADVKTALDILNTDHVPELSYPCLALLEKTLTNATIRYVVISKNGKPVLFAYYQIFTLTAANFNLENNSAFVKHILKAFVNLKKAKAVMLGNVLRNETTSHCYDHSVFTVDEATEAIAGIAEKIAADECATAIVLKELPPITAQAQQLLSENGYSTPFEDQVMDMEVDPNWHTLSDYVNDLSKKYKTRAKKALAAIAPLEIKALTTVEVAAYEQDIDRLFSATVHQQPFTLTQPQPGYFTELKRMYGDSFEVIGFMKDGKLIAFYTAFTGVDYYHIYYVGFDYELNNTYQLYFNILFSGLERAILSGKKVLQLGRTSFDAKASLGAKARKLSYFIKMEYIPDFVVKWFVKYFSAMENSKWKQRNPLKENGAMA